jgi:hypothetical protein
VSWTGRQQHTRVAGDPLAELRETELHLVGLTLAPSDQSR